jgi:CRP/FNR family transcriptional regulator, cyclic AMP receptor protein
MAMTMDLGNALGLLGVAFCFASFVMKRMMSLRVLALASNVCFIAYGLVESLLPSLVLNTALLPVNARRLWEISRLSKEIVRATRDSPVSQWLLPHMDRRSFRAGEVLFRKGETADRLIYVASGKLRLVEIGRLIAAGELIGEIGLFSPDKTRTQTIVCETDGELYEMTDEMIFQLYYLHPKLGFYLMRLLAERLLADVRRHEGHAATA